MGRKVKLEERAPVIETIIGPGRIALTVPHQPPMEANPNSGKHRRDRGKAIKPFRDAVKLAVSSEINRTRLVPTFTTDEIAVRAIIAWGRGRAPFSLDRENARACLKPAIDGLADALGIDDHRVDITRVEQYRDSEGMGWIRLDAREREPDDD